jgi:carbon monoxide dehydrogenase subunit G
VRLHHQSEVAAGPADVWAFLQDTRAVARCLPGAELADELGDDRYQGVLRVAIGPLKMTYTGDVAIADRDPRDRRIILDATGRDGRGSGAVQAHVRLRVSPEGQGARIDVVSDVDLTGRIASLGRGVRDVSNRMFAEFAERLADTVNDPGGSAAPSGGARTARPPGAASGEIKVLPLVWNVTRERFADVLDRLSERVRPR